VVSHARRLIIRLGAGAEALALIASARQTIRAMGGGPAGRSAAAGLTAPRVLPPAI